MGQLLPAAVASNTFARAIRLPIRDPAQVYEPKLDGGRRSCSGSDGPAEQPGGVDALCS